tara:strand:- start:163128 stop:163418 length:291 start_codon:yes stop_codon:yes gene_type:complete
MRGDFVGDQHAHTGTHHAAITAYQAQNGSSARQDPQLWLVADLAAPGQSLYGRAAAKGQGKFAYPLVDFQQWLRYVLKVFIFKIFAFSVFVIAHVR